MKVSYQAKNCHEFVDELATIFVTGDHKMQMETAFQRRKDCQRLRHHILEGEN